MRTLVRSLCTLALLALLGSGALVILTAPTPTEAGQGTGGQPCGGFAGLECPSPKQKCVDDPRDDCDPKRGGADCIGICRGRGASG